MHQPWGEQRYHAKNKAARRFSVGGSRPQASKLAKNRVRLYLTLGRAGKAFHQTAAANQKQSSQEEGRGVGLYLQNGEDHSRWALNRPPQAGLS